MLGKVFDRFVEKSPISVMVRGTLERVLGAGQLDAWFARTAQKQYTRTVLFSTVYDILSQVVFRIKPSVRAAYRDHEATVGASLISVYNKLNGVETHTSAELVRYSAAVLTPLIEQLDGARAPWLPGYRVKILDGNCIEASERRLKVLREVQAGALPGKSLVVYEPTAGLVSDVFPCEDGHAQERSMLGQALDAGDRAPASRSGLPFGNQYVGLSQGRLVRLLPGLGRLQYVGGGDGGVAQRAWRRNHRPRPLPLLCRQRDRPNVSRHDDCHPGGCMARLQPHASREIGRAHV